MKNAAAAIAARALLATVSRTSCQLTLELGVISKISEMMRRVWLGKLVLVRKNDAVTPPTVIKPG